jgi:hypothetical protein
MDMWQVVVWVGGISLGFVALRMLWVAAFDAPKKTSSIPTLDSYLPSDDESDGMDTNPEPRRQESDGDDAGGLEPVEGGTWIELDIKPLFRSSQTPPYGVIDLTEERKKRSS